MTPKEYIEHLDELELEGGDTLHMEVLSQWRLEDGMEAGQFMMILRYLLKEQILGAKVCFL